jgi:hypothetical protein
MHKVAFVRESGTYLEVVGLTPCHSIDDRASTESSTSSDGLGLVIG